MREMSGIPAMTGICWVTGRRAFPLPASCFRPGRRGPPTKRAGNFTAAARTRALVEALGPDHYARLAAVAVSSRCSRSAAHCEGRGTEEAARPRCGSDALRRGCLSASKRLPLRLLS
jgi:hypothetical protein